MQGDARTPGPPVGYGTSYGASEQKCLLLAWVAALERTTLCALPGIRERRVATQSAHQCSSSSSWMSVDGEKMPCLDKEIQNYMLLYASNNWTLRAESSMCLVAQFVNRPNESQLKYDPPPPFLCNRGFWWEPIGGPKKKQLYVRQLSRSQSCGHCDVFGNGYPLVCISLMV